MSAQTSYTITVAEGEALSRFANNERVEKITLGAMLSGPSTIKLTTITGKEFYAPREVLNVMAFNGTVQ